MKKVLFYFLRPLLMVIYLFICLFFRIREHIFLGFSFFIVHAAMLVLSIVCFLRQFII